MLRDRGGSERGSVAITVVLSMTVLLGFAALVVDVGLNWAARTSAQTAADSAALAGASRLLVDGPAAAVLEVQTLLAKNVDGLTGVAGWATDGIEANGEVDCWTLPAGPPDPVAPCLDGSNALQVITPPIQVNYAFAPVYIALQKGSGVESEMTGENTLSIHGLAMFSKWPMRNVHAIPLPNGKDKMWGKEKRLGFLRALFAEIEHPSGTFRAVTIHLDAHCSRAHRRRQMNIILDHLDTLPPMPTLLGGDWNTTTFNSQSSTRAIMGYWRRVFMGPKNVAKNHLPHPQRYFERPLFAELENRGYGYKPFNNVGTGTLHYHVESIEKNTNLRDWVPEWCFPFIFWAANRVGGSVSGRLDWFAGKGIEIAPGSGPKTVGNLVDGNGTPLSDHDAITLDFTLA